MDEVTITKTSANFLTRKIHMLLDNMGIPENWTNLLNLAILLIIVILIVFVLQSIIQRLLTFIFEKANKVTKLSIFKYAINNRVPHFLGLLFPYIFIINVIPIVFADYRSFIKIAVKITDIFMVFIVIWMIMAIIKSFVNLLQEKPAFRHKPMKSYLQVIQIILYIFGAVSIFSILTGKSATVFFTAMGAASAVLLLMFKDTIMGFVSSIQISANNMVMLGDWITMNKYGADGNVEEINLTTVKVRNFDNTITTIPTYSLITDSFQNWRGMQESGGRRLKRSIYVKQNDIRILTDSELDSFEKTDALKGYIKTKREKYAEINNKLNIAENSVLKGFQITNCDLFIQYAIWYLQNNPDIRQDMTVLVREQAPSESGLPIEIYAFINKTSLTDFERISIEIFNHLYSHIKLFSLNVHESSTGTDSYNVYVKEIVK